MKTTIEILTLSLQASAVLVPTLNVEDIGQYVIRICPWGGSMIQIENNNLSKFHTFISHQNCDTQLHYDFYLFKGRYFKIYLKINR